MSKVKNIIYQLFIIVFILCVFPTVYVNAAVKKTAKTTVNIKDVNNSNATISWKKLSGVDGYYIYRRVDGHAYRKIATVSKNKTSYKDVFYKTLNRTEKGYLNTKTNGIYNTFIFRNKYFVDPSYHPFIYTVRAYKKSKGKIILGNYYKEGAIRLTTALITKAKKNGSKVTMTWARVSGADGYYIYEATEKSSFGIHYATVKQSSFTRINATMTKTLTCKSSSSRFAVRAYRKEKGKVVTAPKYGTFSVSQQKYANTKILFVGDSITYGLPYRGVDADIYSYPYRVQQRTGASIYNTGIPSACFTRNPSRHNGQSLLDSVILPVNEGKSMYSHISGCEYSVHTNEKGYSLKDFDVVVMNVGTNEYELDNTCNTIDGFRDALTEVYTYIKNASQMRIEEGKEPIKVIYMDLFNRDFMASKPYAATGCKNGLGYVLGDYQAMINQVSQAFNDGITLDVYQMPTTSYCSCKNMNNGYTITVPATGRNIKTTNCNYTTSDNLHPTRETYAKIGDGLVNFMLQHDILK